MRFFSDAKSLNKFVPISRFKVFNIHPTKLFLFRSVEITQNFNAIGCKQSVNAFVF